ncbi:MAG: hypothetical protein ACKOC5_01630, partial [Chloroflexota bacterium]
MKFLLSTLLALLTAALLLHPAPARAGLSTQAAPEPLLAPIGGGYNPETIAGLSEVLVQRSRGEPLRILVLPLAYPTNPLSVAEKDRAEYLKTADERRAGIEAACLQAAPQGCRAELAPVLTRADADAAGVADYLAEPPSAVFILGGDPLVASQVLSGTALERALEQAYRQGTLISGTGAGGLLQSRTLLAGYRANYDAGNALEFGAVETGFPGLSFGAPQVIIDQGFTLRSRAARLLNAISRPGAPHIGIGLENETGVLLSAAGDIRAAFGAYTATILDAETYHAAQGVQYNGERSLISLRNVLVQVLAPGAGAYDLRTRRHSLAGAPARLERSYSGLQTPAGAGPLLLCAAPFDAPAGRQALTRFANWSGGQQAHQLVVTAGYADAQQARQAAEALQALLPTASTALAAPARGALPAIDPDVSGVILSIGETAAVNPAVLQNLAAAWRSGLPLLVDRGAIPLTGQYFAGSLPAAPESPEAARRAMQGLLAGALETRPGLGLLGVNLVVRVQEDNRWGDLYGLAYQFPALLALGLPDGAALEVTAAGPQALG